VNISEVARSAGLSASGVRWYESAGILPPARRGPNGYRAYSERDRSLLQLIATLRRLGVSPTEAGSLALRFVEGDVPSSDVELILSARRTDINRQQATLEGLIDELNDLQTTLAGTTHRALGRDSTDGGIRVLFLCNANSGRSQMGEALLRQIGGAAFSVSSAGIEHRPVNPFAVEALKEQGIDWSAARSKDVSELHEQFFDYVITLSDSSRDNCPALPGPHNTLHWNLRDPASTAGPDEVRLEAYRETITALRLRLLPFIELAMMARSQERNLK
jgi:arsenate reductase